MMPDLASRDVLCCGPAGFMDEVRRVHAAEGGDPRRFQVEHFAPVLAPLVASDALGRWRGLHRRGRRAHVPGAGL